MKPLESIIFFFFLYVGSFEMNVYQSQQDINKISKLVKNKFMFAFWNLDLDLNLNFKSTDLKCHDFKSIDFRYHFKFKNFKSLKFLVNYICQIQILDIFKTIQTRYLDFINPNPNQYVQILPSKCTLLMNMKLLRSQTYMSSKDV